MSKVRVRTAPSPTGFPHIGNTWAALINFLFARKNNGKFIFRLEDTDRERFIPESINRLYETLHWLGLEYDEGPDIGGPFVPYVQSERLDLYQKYARLLVDKDLAYKDKGAVWFRTLKEGKTSWLDLVGNRNIEFENSTQEDFVILKSDGFPTYHLANVVDDYLMKITHVIRGGEWISSTPKHIMLYQALNWESPQFAHLPLLLSPSRSKLSKRHGAKSVLEFRDEGYLKEALLNFMVLLGWSPPSGKEILALEEMIEEFDLKDINLASPIFETTKLDWMNGMWIRRKSDKELLQLIKPFAPKDADTSLINKTIPLVKERLVKLSDYSTLAGFFFEEPKIDKELFNKNAGEQLSAASEVLKEIKVWDKTNIENTLSDLIKKRGWKTGDFFMNFRIAITGSRVTPPITDSIEILGREKTLRRLEKALNL